jgi:AcrR family transcriptional regulator
MALDIAQILAYVEGDRTVWSKHGRGTVTDVISDLAETEKTDLAEHEHSAKRRQIMDGAREVFLAQGFDAASMGEIARKARVSKGTLYVYFDSKEQLFEAIAHEACAAQAEAVFSSIWQIATSKQSSHSSARGSSNFFADREPCRRCAPS